MGYQSIYDQFRANGLTEAGALGMLGNFDCESNCISYRLQGDFSQYYNVSKQYTLDVDTGSISRNQIPVRRADTDSRCGHGPRGRQHCGTSGRCAAGPSEMSICR